MYLNTAFFMPNFYNKKLPNIFNEFFYPACEHHSHNTRLASKSAYSLPLVRTNDLIRSKLLNLLLYSKDNICRSKLLNQGEYMQQRTVDLLLHQGEYMHKQTADQLLSQREYMQEQTVNLL